MTKKQAAAKKRDRGRTYLLDQLPDHPWLDAQARAESEGRAMRWVILKLLEEYVKHGLRSNHLS
jgi:hypothetical protein